VTIGCSVMLTPGLSGPPDTGTITAVFPPFVTAGGMPLATAGSLCMMVNSVWGFAYPMMIGPVASSGVTVSGRGLVRMLDRVPTPPGVMMILGPPAATFVIDSWPP
jgi:hypothetical protein